MADGIWWSTKRGRKPNVAAGPEAAAATEAAGAGEGAEAAAGAEIGGTAEIAATEGIAGSLRRTAASCRVRVLGPDQEEGLSQGRVAFAVARMWDFREVARGCPHPKRALQKHFGP